MNNSIPILSSAAGIMLLVGGAVIHSESMSLVVPVSVMVAIVGATWNLSSRLTALQADVKTLLERVNKLPCQTGGAYECRTGKKRTRSDNKTRVNSDRSA